MAVALPPTLTTTSGRLSSLLAAVTSLLSLRQRVGEAQGTHFKASLDQEKEPW